MKNKILLLITLVFLLSLTFVSAQQTCITFFYGDGCLACAKTIPLINSLEEKYPNLQIERLEIYKDRSNLQLLNSLQEKYSIPENYRGIPTVFIGEKYLVGSTQIKNNLEKEILQNPNSECVKVGVSSKPKIETLSIITIIGAAIIDSINPCAIAVLLILINALLISGNKKRAIKAGLAFTLSIYISYFLFGLGLFSVLQISGLTYWFYKIVGLLAILIGLANIKDYFWYGKGFVMEIPRRWRPRLQGILKKVTSPLGAFLIGFVVCLFELPCTGGPYIFILGLLAEKTTQIVAVPLLLMYNLFFILPLLVITGLVYLGFTNVENTTKWKERNIKILHLIAGVVMLGLGILVVSGII